MQCKPSNHRIEVVQLIYVFVHIVYSKLPPSSRNNTTILNYSLYSSESVFFLEWGVGDIYLRYVTWVSSSCLDFEDSVWDLIVWRLWQPMESEQANVELDTHKWEGNGPSNPFSYFHKIYCKQLLCYISSSLKFNFNILDVYLLAD
jgi:hypothetical protein